MLEDIGSRDDGLVIARGIEICHRWSRRRLLDDLFLFCSILFSSQWWILFYRFNRLETLQKRLTRTVMLAKYYAHTDPLFKQAAILKNSDMLRISVRQIYDKHQHGKLPNNFYNFNFTTQGSHHFYDTRSIGQIRTDKTRAWFYHNKIRPFLP